MEKLCSLLLVAKKVFVLFRFYGDVLCLTRNTFYCHCLWRLLGTYKWSKKLGAFIPQFPLQLCGWFRGSFAWRTSIALYIHTVTAGWSSGLRSRLQNQRSRVQIPVVSRGFCENKYTCSRVMAVYVYYYPYNGYVHDLCMLSITQVLNDI
jgi:hypothetical protein